MGVDPEKLNPGPNAYTRKVLVLCDRFWGAGRPRSCTRSSVLTRGGLGRQFVRFLYLHICSRCSNIRYKWRIYETSNYPLEL